MATRKDSEAVRVAQVRRLWQGLYPRRERIFTKVLIFYGWLQKYRQDLVPRVKGDPYQQLKVDLSGLVERE